MKKIFFSLCLLGFQFTILANSTATDNERYYQACVQTCMSFYDNPGHGLRSCIDDCSNRYPLKTEEPKKPQWCETYEDDCTRPPNDF